MSKQQLYLIRCYKWIPLIPNEAWGRHLYLVVSLGFKHTTCIGCEAWEQVGHKGSLLDDLLHLNMLELILPVCAKYV